MENIIEKHRQKYKNFGKSFCPYLNKDVEFTMAGFKHLIWKTDQSMRTHTEIKQRLDSLEVVKEIIEKSGTLQEIEKLEDKTFYAFIGIISDKKYKVVVSTAKENRLIFNSVIPKWITSKRDKLLYKKGMNIEQTKKPS